MAQQSSRIGLVVVVVLLISFAAFFVIALRDSADRYSNLAHRVGTGGNKIGVLPLRGVILESEDFIKQLDEFVDDDNIKAIVIRIDSPGGGVGPSQEIYRAIRKANEQKPVVTSVGNVCASGGYYAALGTRHIVSNPGSLVGSISVIMQFVDASELIAWAKLKPEIIKSGPYKDMGNPTRSLTAAERATLQSLVNSVHSQFVTAVVDGRRAAGMTTEAAAAIADGRVFSGEQALELKLVDTLGSLQDAVETAAKMAGIEGKPKTVYPLKKKSKLLDFLLEESEARALRESLTNVNRWQPMYLWQP